MEKAQRIIICLFLVFLNSLFAQRVPQSYFAIPQLDETYHHKVDSLKNIVQSNPNDLQTLEILGDHYGAHYQWKEAMDVYKNLVGLAPKRASYQFKYGGVLGVLAANVPRIKSLPYVRPMKAAFEKVIEIDNRHSEAQWVLLELYNALPFFLGGSDSKAQMMVDEINKTSPLEGALSQGFLWAKLNQFSKAEDSYRKAAAMISDKSCESLSQIIERNQTFYELGKALLFLKLSPDLAICCFTYFVEHYSSKDGLPLSFGLERLAQVYYQKGNIEKANFFHQQAVSQLPTVVSDLQKLDGFLGLEIVSFSSK